MATAIINTISNPEDSMGTHPKKEEIVQQAFEVFYRHGFQATAIDSLLANTGISKRTLYKYFSSKEALIAAAIEYYELIVFENIFNQLEARAYSAQEKLLALFDIKQAFLEAENFNGCFAMTARLEYAGQSADKFACIDQACRYFFAKIEAVIFNLCRETESPHPEALARQIMVLFQGAIVYAQILGDSSPLATSRGVVEHLLNTENFQKKAL